MTSREGGYKIQSCPIVAVAFDISAAKNWSYQVGRAYTFIFCLTISKYFLSFGRINNESVIITGKDTSIDVYIPITQWSSYGFNLVLNTLLY